MILGYIIVAIISATVGFAMACLCEASQEDIDEWDK